jgi:hypothetical protein
MISLKLYDNALIISFPPFEKKVTGDRFFWNKEKRNKEKGR